MISVNFDEGYKKYAVNGDENRVIRIKTADINLIERAESAFKKIESLKEKYNGDLTKNALLEFDADVRQLIDEAFDSDICSVAFGNSNICTIVGDGKYLFEAFFEAFMPILEADAKAAVMTKKVNKPQIRPEVNKYINVPKAAPIAGLAEPYRPAMPDVSSLTAEEKRELLARLIS